MIKKVLKVLGIVFLLIVLTLSISYFTLSRTPKNADIIKEMHDPELQSKYRLGRVFASLMTKEWGVQMFNSLSSSLEGADIEGFDNQERFIKMAEGHILRVRIFKPKNVQGKLPAMLFIHGGGYFAGLPERALPLYEDFLKRRDIVIIAPAYRLSIDHPYPAGFNDCYETLLWMKENANELGIYNDNYIIAGLSAGGGMTAALALKARDTKEVRIAFQMPIYPMIDYRQNTKSAQKTGTLIWDSQSNKHGWNQYLKGIEGQDIPAYASPAMTKDFSGLPPTITYVGDLEPFMDETINYVENLKAAGVPTKFKLFNGAYHAFNSLSPETVIGKAANKFQVDAFEEYFDLYIKNPEFDTIKVDSLQAKLK